MARLAAGERARLPDSAFAYVDRQGRRRLPIHDEAHVRNALARFNQVTFEDDAARERAVVRLLKAARRYRIVPVGFVTSQLERQRPSPTADLPTGFLTLVMTDIEGSTALLDRLGERYGELLDAVCAVLEGAVEGRGRVVESRADELFAVFECPHDAVLMAVDVQRALPSTSWPGGAEVRVRIGIHSGYPTRGHGNYIGMAVHTAARVSAAAHGGQVLVSGDTRTALTGYPLAGVGLRSLGTHRLRGIPDAVDLYQVTADGLARGFPPPRTVHGAA